MSDAIEGVTHSLCTLEFVDHNEIYDWFVRNTPPIIIDADVHRNGYAKDSSVTGSRSEPRRSYPRQTEYGRLNLEYTVTSKRKLAALVEASVVEGWDDPRMPTLAGLRRRGIPAAAIRLFCSRVGVARVGGSVVEQSMLDTSVREVLEGRGENTNPTELSVATQNWVTPRAMAVRDPLPVTLTSLAEPLQLSLPRHPDHLETLGHREVPLTR
jgi:glutaminyl-tRNA synthetase